MIRKLFDRKFVLVLLMIILALLIIGLIELLSIMLIRSQSPIGWVLFGVILFLGSYGLRKKVTFLSLGSISQWLKIHIAAGFFSFLLFILHAGISLPKGQLEIILYVIYMLIFASGVIGLILTRLIPPRLNSRGEEVIYERIPLYLGRIRNKVEASVFQSVEEGNSSVISDFYLKHLRIFFLKPANLTRHLFHSESHKRSILLKISEQERFLSDKEKEIIQEIKEQVCVKDDLDYQYSLQTVLKVWLFIHVPLTYSLILLAMMHAVITSAFSSII